MARLILIHGRAFWRRNSEVVLYSFYKNWAYNLTYVYFAFVTGERAPASMLARHCTGAPAARAPPSAVCPVTCSSYGSRPAASGLTCRRARPAPPRPALPPRHRAAWSCQALYTTGLIATLNLFWAAVPIIVYAFFEQARSSLHATLAPSQRRTRQRAKPAHARVHRRAMSAVCACVCLSLCVQEVSHQTIMEYPFLYEDSMHATRAKFLWSMFRWNLLVSSHAPLRFRCPGAARNLHAAARTA